MRIAPSLHRIGSSLVNSYLVEEAGGVTIIDAGLPAYWSLLEGELATMGRSLDDVRGVVLTHGDTDHIGFAERLRRERGVPVYVHEADAARARGEVSKPTFGWGPMKIGPLLGFLVYSARRGGLRIAPLKEVSTIVDGQTLDLPGSPRIIHIPGHTPGSVAVHVPAVNALFVGDAMTTRSVLTGEQGPRTAPFTLAVPEALTSLERIEGIEAVYLLPGHGDPWTGGVAEAIRRMREAAPATSRLLEQESLEPRQDELQRNDRDGCEGNRHDCDRGGGVEVPAPIADRAVDEGGNESHDDEGRCQDHDQRGRRHGCIVATGQKSVPRKSAEEPAWPIQSSCHRTSSVACTAVAVD